MRTGYIWFCQEEPMARQSSKRPPPVGANRGKEAAPPLVASIRKTGYATLTVTDSTKQGPMRRIARQTTIEDRLEAKASVADQRDYSGQCSLGQMSREERRKFLFGE